ncbi:hypothetical protein [Escherichia coli]|uniref:hypothetical protein n=1 Tax=Escherichia coli TaxID=562 RepID=UPI0031344662
MSPPSPRHPKLWNQLNGLYADVLEEPVTATLYMPKAVRDWLAMVGNGKVSAGLRKLIEMADIPELKNAWRQ